MSGTTVRKMSDIYENSGQNSLFLAKYMDGWTSLIWTGVAHVTDTSWSENTLRIALARSGAEINSFLVLKLKTDVIYKHVQIYKPEFSSFPKIPVIFDRGFELYLRENFW